MNSIFKKIYFSIIITTFCTAFRLVFLAYLPQKRNPSVYCCVVSTRIETIQILRKSQFYFQEKYFSIIITPFCISVCIPSLRRYLCPVVIDNLRCHRCSSSLFAYLTVDLITFSGITEWTEKKRKNKEVTVSHIWNFFSPCVPRVSSLRHRHLPHLPSAA